MSLSNFWDEMSELIEHYNLLRHPFYEAWGKGLLTLLDIREYAIQYYHPHLISRLPQRVRSASATR